MSASQLRWGLLAPADISKSIIPAVRASSHSELVAVSSRNLGRAEAFAELWDIPRAYGSYEDLLGDPEVDVAYVALPQALHAEWVIKAADAGKHVLCEKPMATSLNDIDRIFAASAKNDVVVLEAMMFRYHPQISRVQEIIADGAIGVVRLIRASFSYPMNMPDSDSVPALLDPALGGGSLWDIGCYAVGFVRAVVGSDPIEVTGMEVTGPTDVDLTFVGVMRYRDGILAQFDSSFQAPLRWSAEIVGSSGSISLDEPWNHRPDDPGVVTLTTIQGDELIPVDEANAYHCEVDFLAACVIDGASSPLPLSETRGNTSALVALHESSRRTRVVTLEQEVSSDV